MSDRVDLARLDNALAESGFRWTMGRELDTGDLNAISDAARAVLSAPTARWCQTHGAQAVDESECVVSVAIGSEETNCVIDVVVALVPVETR